MIIPTDQQRQVMNYPGLSLAVVAPAGCGKTEALALRVLGLLDRGMVRPNQRILVATFTNRARDNVLSRVKAYLPYRTIRDHVTVTNFHGLAARLFRAHANVIGMDSEWAIPESDWVGQQCKARNLKYEETESVEALLGRIKRDAVDDAAVEQQLIRSKNANALTIERQRKDEHRLTYDDLPRLAELILECGAVADLLQHHFAAVIVDEFQDLTPQQYRIVARISAERTTFAGDLAQGIYAFAGAKPLLIERLVKQECPETIVFSESHRSAPAVLRAVNALVPITKGVALTCARPDAWPGGGIAALRSFHSVQEEAAWIVDLCQTLLDRAPNHRIGVMTRTAARRRFVDNALESSGLPISRWSDPFLDTAAARHLKDMLANLSLAKLARAKNPMEYLREFSRIADIDEPSTREALADALIWCQDQLDGGLALQEIRKRVRVGDDTTLLTLTGVHLLTGHVGKGQQFDWVVIAGVEDGAIPDFRADTPEALAEEARIFSVMLSRARLGVILTRSTSVPARSGVAYSKQPSRFLADLRGSLVDGAGLEAWLSVTPWEALATE